MAMAASCSRITLPDNIAMAEWEGSRFYWNEDQRNVHIWASYMAQGERYLIGGCHTWDVTPPAGLAQLNATLELSHPPFFPHLPPVPVVQEGLTNFDLYNFLEIILADVNPAYRLVLVGPVPVPDLLGNIHRAQFSNLIENYITQSTNGPIGLPSNNALLAPGQYVFFLQRRSISAGGSVSDRRNARLRPEVRERDFRCRASSTIVPTRDRGPNYYAFNVVHIYPFSQINDVHTIAPHLAPLITGQAWGDKPQNAMLMRADLHEFFDDYQIGFGPTGPGANVPLKGFKFERAGAKTFIPGLVLFERLALPAHQWNRSQDQPRGRWRPTPDVDSRLLLHHFRTCVLWHVAGYGRDEGH
ncbi:hypothetical protein C8F01DRAFT_1100765 [Mycena amicta]|nr:hypothetical protein C8F01DRAFT_1100765 [Mycena amicta]